MKFTQIDPTLPVGKFDFEGRLVFFRKGDTLAGALLAAGAPSFRDSPISGAARAPYCLMGVCFECLLRVDGVDNVRACMMPAVDGMLVTRQVMVGSDPAEAR